MRVRVSAIVATLLIAVLTAAPAGAVTNGVPDGEGHPYVGLAVFYDADGNPTHRCSGTLLAPKVFLTAGHCTSGTASAQVWFDSDLTGHPGYPFEGGITGTPYTHWAFDDFASFPNTSDVGVIVLDKRVRLDVYGALPELGLLDSMATQRGQQETWFTIVGYGLQDVRPEVMADRVRYVGTTKLVNLNSALTDGYNIHESKGLCFGDSGGPAFLNDTNIVVGISSFVLNQNCAGAGFSYRTDISNAQDFIWQFF